MNAKICLAALFAVVATTANAQGPQLCQNSCRGDRPGQNTFVSSCCRHHEVNFRTNFNECCINSCMINSPCSWEDSGAGST
eukprot:jgi/Phyca11/124564/e_gw1.54.208.1